MAEKFPSLESSKHRAFALDLARFGEDGGRAALVVAERARLSLHWTRADGTWGGTTRDHAGLSQSPRRPDEVASLGWTGRVGIAAARDDVVLVYKRRFVLADGSGLTSSRDLYVDRFGADPVTGELAGGTPVPLPRDGLNIERFGFSVWADLVDGRLLIVAQAVRAGAVPMLALLDTAWPPPSAAAIQDAAAWRVTDLDPGGWDFDARREGARLVVLHRRDPATHELTLSLVDPAFGGAATVPLSDASNAPIRLSQLRRPSLTLVDVHLPSRSVTAMDAELGFGENPRLHHLTPIIATVDQLSDGTMTLAAGQLRLERLRAESRLLMRTQRGWRTALLFAESLRWAITRSSFARVHVALGVTPAGGAGGLRLSWAPLWSERPVALFKRELTEKGQLLTLAHQDPQLGALRATTFRVFEDDGGETLRASPEQFAVLDIGHRHITPPPGDAATPLEHRQLRPGPFESAGFHADVPNEGLRVVRAENSGNTLAGVLAAVANLPASGYAYTDMGDGGVRVVFEPGLDMPPPTAAIDDKIFEPAWVAEPSVPGRAWVRLETPGFVDTRLPGVFTPVGTPPPTSLACLQQQSLDGLVFAAAMSRDVTPLSTADPLTFALAGDVGRVRYAEAPSGADADRVTLVVLDRTAARACQSFVVGASTTSPPRPVVSDGQQPFVVELHRREGLAFAGDPLTFSARLPEEPSAGVTFTWTFSDGTTATGAEVVHVFTATLPDFSRAAPGGVLADHVITLTATTADGRVATVSTTLPLERSLWATVWTAYSAFRRAPDNLLDDNGDWSITAEEWASYLAPGLFVRDATMSFYRYRLRYVVDADGRGTRVEVTIGTEHAGRFRALGRASGQGDLEYEVPIAVNLGRVVFTGQFGSGLGAFVDVSAVAATLAVRQKFTLGVQTSERRDRLDDSENLQRRALFSPLSMVPSAIAALPVEATSHTVGALRVEGGLSARSWALGVLIGAVAAAVGTAVVVAILWPILSIAPVISAITISVLVALIVAAGLSALALLVLDALVVRPMIRSTLLEALSAPEVTAGLRASGLVAYAGEGLAEALAMAFARQAEADGLAVSPPTADGRTRVRSPGVEIVVVGEGVAKALVRVAG